jgi:hypothetical protein
LKTALSKAINVFLQLWDHYPSKMQMENLPRLLDAFKERTVLGEKLNEFSSTPNADTAAAIKVESTEDLALTRPRASTYVFLSNLVL